MSELRVASRYAKSLIELAAEKGILEQVHDDMKLFSNTISQNRDFQMLLRNPIVKSDKKMAVLNSVFKGKVQEMTLAFFTIVTRKNREAILEFVATEFEKQYNLMKGIQRASVTSAAPLSPALRQQLGERLANETGKTIQLEEMIDPSLIGGFVLRVGDRQIDSSVKNSLRKLKNNFKDNSYINKL
ncbi:ATP synthase F1 subunit delta [Pontibacter burrus]|uniref:ATP synthase subunit delta n=1 Tax=Pontibacter burrus TaxID=2704466 RepID=A0A6B3LKT2_9BACT|nr:ATP synthase F1 subunit delta [Pontibacter burrus]NEM96563.1 ATP synthase F1 subunit delta [Pontibacter burrus]